MTILAGLCSLIMCLLIGEGRWAEKIIATVIIICLYLIGYFEGVKDGKNEKK